MTDTDWNDAEKLKADLYAVLCERNEMATEITELRAEIDRLRAALKNIAATEASWGGIERMRQLARAALEPKP